MQKSTAIACSNIAFIKYWGNADHTLRLAANSSLSMNLADLTVTATVAFDPALPEDRLTINGQPASAAAAKRVFAHLNLIRRRAGLPHRAEVRTESNFPAGAGIASSAAAFAALAVAGAAAAGLQLSEAELSALARRGSGSASRSVPGGYCQWLAGGSDATSYATSIAPPEHWALHDVVAIVSTEHKRTGSSDGHALAETSVLQTARLLSAPARFLACKRAILRRDLQTLGPLIEEDAILMHSVMMTSHPPLYYWTPATLEIIHAVQRWRADGLPVYFTIDAGPNVHLICESRHAETVAAEARALPGVRQVLQSGVGGPARLLHAD
ncbi:MAG: diphosphomevalonate decarboxylase [Caldilineae bacterium]|nr:MAG: diphosphomevalonate decarboxylase [Caldilineae bacterium]